MSLKLKFTSSVVIGIFLLWCGAVGLFGVLWSSLILNKIGETGGVFADIGRYRTLAFLVSLPMFSFGVFLFCQLFRPIVSRLYVPALLFWAGLVFLLGTIYLRCTAFQQGGAPYLDEISAIGGLVYKASVVAMSLGGLIAFFLIRSCVRSNERISE